MLAVDFGSSNTAAAFRDRRGGVHQISLSHNGWLMPSAVLYSAANTLVGRTAVQAALTDPDAFEPAPKRRLAEREIQLGPDLVAVTDLVAAVLHEVFAKAQREMGVALDRVVLTHPDKWALPMQEMLREAAVTAGVDGAKIRLISEASAAAWFYTVTERSLPVGARLAVFDFGAGTCDVAVLDKQPDGTFSVVASDGVEGLGGQDLDARIDAWVRRQLAEADPVLAEELRQPGAIGSRLTLNDRIREAKEALSEASQATIAVANGTRTHLLTLTRDEFDQLISTDLDRAVELTENVLAAAQRIRPADRAPMIYLTGGSSAIPAVHTRLNALGQLGVLGDPKTVVSQGALHAMANKWDVEGQTLFVRRPHGLPPKRDPEPPPPPETPWYAALPKRPTPQPPPPPPPPPRPPTPSGPNRSAPWPIPQQAGALSRLASARAGVGDEVDVSAFSSSSARRGEQWLVQALVHRPESDVEATQLVRETASEAGRRGVRSLAVPVPPGAPLTVQLALPGLPVRDSVQQVRWSGRPEALQFWVDIPPQFKRPMAVATIAVSWRGIPLGSVKWRVQITEERRPSALELQSGVITRFRKAFISYATRDSEKVLARRQLLHQVGLDYFQDATGADPAIRWEQELRQIAECDLFLLYWSTAARDSERVRRETAHALQLAEQRGEWGGPTLHPVFIEGPPVPAPWPEVAPHFMGQK